VRLMERAFAARWLVRPANVAARLPDRGSASIAARTGTGRATAETVIGATAATSAATLDTSSETATERHVAPTAGARAGRGAEEEAGGTGTEADLAADRDPGPALTAADTADLGLALVIVAAAPRLAAGRAAAAKIGRMPRARMPVMRPTAAEMVLRPLHLSGSARKMVAGLEDTLQWAMPSWRRCEQPRAARAHELYAE